MNTYKAISVKQPWAWAIFHGKPIENRSRPWKHVGPVMIHASKTFDHIGYHWLLDHRDLLDEEIPHPDKYLFGGIIGRVDMTDCVCNHSSPFFFGPWGYVFKNQKSLDFIKCPGSQGVFNVEV